MLGAVPFAQQHSSRLERRSRRQRDGPSSRGIVGDFCQQSARGGLEPTERLFLNPIGQRADQQIAADAPWRFGAVERPPVFLKIGGVACPSAAISCASAEVVEETLCFMCCPPSSAGSHTHCSGSPPKPVNVFTLHSPSHRLRSSPSRQRK